jgi:hypothetical protein
VPTRILTPDVAAFGCTAESCDFRDLTAVLGDLGAAIRGLCTQRHAAIDSRVRHSIRSTGRPAKENLWRFGGDWRLNEGSLYV